MQLSQFSFLIALGLGVVLVIAATWSQPRQRPWGLVAAILLLLGWAVFRPGAGGTATADTLHAALASGQPVVVEVYSDY
jgi:ammonia channel protein AmtB